ncbi:MAG: putative sugar nucleotidyl transferase [Candidatus Hatepunaea meridiana]|nr:putative sugar nucleotidyl transferase [Candidatus Hatepunaea meridiana]
MQQQFVCIFEDKGFDSFASLTQTRAVWDLRCGAYTLGEKYKAKFKSSQLRFHLRSNLKAIYEENGFITEKLNPALDDGCWLFINGRSILADETIAQMMSTTDDAVFVSKGKPVGFKISGENLQLVDPSSGEPIDYSCLDKLPRIEVEAQVIDYPWQLVKIAGEQISVDLERANKDNPGNPPEDSCFIRVSILNKLRITGKVDIRPGVIVDAEKHPVRLEDGARIGAGVIIDASEGPVWIAENAQVEPGVVLMGPVYIGPHSIVRRHARIYDGCCLGPHCRVGGEVSGTILHSYSNKQHSGYLGTSYIGSWVNLGAATDNSDLKNNYHPIDVMINAKKINTGDLHIGTFIGDFTCTAIHTRLNSGTVIGVCCNIFGNDFPIKEVPSFTWYGSDGYQEYRFDKAIETVRTIMPRRNRELTPALEVLLKDIFTGSESAREKVIND